MDDQLEPKTDSRKGVFIKTYGCQMNEYDTQKLYKILESDYRPVDSPEAAGLVLINTCSVRDKPEQKLYSMLGRMNELKRRNPELKVGVCGCVAQQEGDRIVERSPAVDIVFGTHNLSLVPSLLRLRQEGAPPQVAVDYRDEWEELPLGFSERDLTRNGQRNNVTAFVSISRGCNKNCTYCIVPTTRGPEVSRSADEIVREVRLMAHRGTKEIVLLGQTVNSYGRDLSPRMSFVELLRKVAAVPGVERIRFTSPHPQEVRDDFIEFVTSEPKVARHIHMPLQSGSDRILRLMNRNYRRSRYMQIIESLKQRVPDIGITTDLIVGFPSETEADFEDTLSAMREVDFDASFSFAFSPRPGTEAAALKEELTHAQKIERLMRLQALQDEITTRRLMAWVGRETEILVDGETQRDSRCVQGRLSQNIVVNLECPIPEVRLGDLVKVRIKAANRFTLLAEPVPAPDVDADVKTVVSCNY